MAIAGLVLGILGVVYFLLVILLVAVTGVHYRSSETLLGALLVRR
jgi:hypothetical protein